MNGGEERVFVRGSQASWRGDEEGGLCGYIAANVKDARSHKLDRGIKVAMLIFLVSA